MIQVIENVPANIAAFRAIDKVEAHHYKEVVIPVIDALVERQGKINFLLVLENHLSDFTIGALLQDLGVGLNHFTQWHKMAIVSNSKAIRTFTDIFSYVAPGEAKGFRHGELSQAIEWAST